MFKACCASIAAALLTGIAVPAVAQSPAAQTETKTTAEAAENSDEIVCQKQEITGSRLGVKRICMTRSQWADRRLQDRQELERVQTQRGGKAE